MFWNLRLKTFMNINLSETESFYMRRFAALQFPGSISNYSTRHPIHFLQEKSGEQIEVPASEFNEHDIVAIVNEADNGNSFDTLEELVADFLEIDAYNQDEIDAYNKVANREDKPQFVTYKQAMKTNFIPGCYDEVFDAEDYLAAYSIPVEYVKFYRAPDAWDVKAVSFTHKGAKEMAKDMANHIFRQTRFYAFTTCDGDFPVMMNFMYRVGKEALNEETKGYKTTVKFLMSEDEIRDKMQRNPNHLFDAAKIVIDFPAPRTIEDAEVKQVCLTVTIKGEIREFHGSHFPVNSVRVKLDAQYLHKECQYPFECDRYLEALKEEDNIITMFNYIAYC